MFENSYKMKNVLILLIVFLFVNESEAQIPGFSLGPKVGYNSNRFTTDFDSITSDPNGAFNVGAFVRIGKKIYFQPEVNYVIKGGELKIGGLGSQQIRLESISIPMLLGVRPINAGVFNLRFMAGPTFSFVSSKSLKPKEVLANWPIQTVDDLKESFWSFQMGGGIDLFLLTIDLRYELGVDNIYSGEDDFKLRNNLFNISIGIKLL